MGGIAVSASRFASCLVLVLLGGTLLQQGGYYDTALYRWEIMLYACWGAAAAVMSWAERRMHRRTSRIGEASGMMGYGAGGRRTAAMLGSPGIWLLFLAAAYAVRLVLPGPPASVLGTVHEALRFA